MISFPETFNDLFFPFPPPFSRSRDHVLSSLSLTRHPSLEQASSFLTSEQVNKCSIPGTG